jgi:hypothetical protein
MLKSDKVVTRVNVKFYLHNIMMESCGTNCENNSLSIKPQPFMIQVTLQDLGSVCILYSGYGFGKTGPFFGKIISIHLTDLR